jgi:hypothetical protein
MEEISHNPVQEPAPMRSNLLTILCILTFIGSGINLFSSLIISLFYDQFLDILNNINDTLQLPGIEMIEEGKASFFAASSVIYAGSIAGAILMWKLKKAGFHIYTIFQILLILSPMYFFHLPFPSTLDVIFSGIFIILYSVNLKNMSEYGGTKGTA